jgi:hypothetical protein
VDLSGIIFVVLAVGWAAYLLPKALKHHDDLSMSRPVETFSDSVRVVGASTPTQPASTPSATDVAPVEPPKAARKIKITREAARRAARRRRRVLVVLLMAAAGVATTSYLAYTPWSSTAIPGGAILVFLLVARFAVRRQQVRTAVPVPADDNLGDPAKAVEPMAPSRAMAPAEVELDLGREDTQGLSREALAEAVAAPVLDDGALWDPLPVTLPTYVNKARARRTVRTIEMTGMTSSGHDAADTELARSAAEEAAAAEVEVDAEIEAEKRRAAGA